MTAASSHSNMPAAEVEISPSLVTALLEEQHPDLAGLGLVELGTGWDNVMYRLGDDFTVRLPRRELAAPLVEYEQRWLPELAPRLPLPVSAPVRTGKPSAALGYPWNWSVLPWFDGGPVGDNPPRDLETAAVDLGQFLAALHTPAPVDAPTNQWRGGPLSARREMTVERIGRLPAGQDRDELLERWQRCMDNPDYNGQPLWLHGDLHPFNILQADGRINAVIDFGDITSGDPATDLAIGFSLFDGASRSAFRAAADSRTRPIDETTWLRAEGWCLSVGIAVLDNSADNPTMSKMAKRMIFGAG